MKKLYITALIFLFYPFNPSCAAGTVFSEYFLDETLRIDYYHVGDKDREYITLDHLYRQGTWAGNPASLVDHFNNGRYYVKVFAPGTGKLLFSRGFDSYFGEYQTTDSAARGIKRTYHETALVPFPRNKVKFVIEKRNRENILEPVFSEMIAPGDISINNEPSIAGVKVFKSRETGNPHNKVDIAFIAEGYRAEDEKKFEADLKKVTNILFSQEPYKRRRSEFNIYGVFKPSLQKGCDEPGRGIYRNTAVGASFNSLGSSRYLLTEENRRLRDIAAHVPYDTLVILVNQERYGGGGIYNSFCVMTSDHFQAAYLLLHEFGHSFSGLADEYYSSSVAYNDFYPRGVEPTEPNITALLDPGKLKWKDLVEEGLPLPTPWEKEAFEAGAKGFQASRGELNRQIDALTKAGGKDEEIGELKRKLYELQVQNSRSTDALLAKSPLHGKVGAFEGAGYSAKGLYRPMLNCIMFTIGRKPYCKVCEAAVDRVISHYTD